MIGQIQVSLLEIHFFCTVFQLHFDEKVTVKYTSVGQIWLNFHDLLPLVQVYFFQVHIFCTVLVYDVWVSHMQMQFVVSIDQKK